MTLIAGKQPFTGTEQAAPGNLRLSNELYVNDNGGNVRKKEAVVAWTCRQKANGRPRDTYITHIVNRKKETRLHTQRLARAIHRLIPDAIAISRINMPFRKKRCVRYYFF